MAKTAAETRMDAIEARQDRHERECLEFKSETRESLGKLNWIAAKWCGALVAASAVIQWSIVHFGGPNQAELVKAIVTEVLNHK